MLAYLGVGWIGLEAVCKRTGLVLISKGDITKSGMTYRTTFNKPGGMKKNLRKAVLYVCTSDIVPKYISDAGQLPHLNSSIGPALVAVVGLCWLKAMRFLEMQQLTKITFEAPQAVPAAGNGLYTTSGGYSLLVEYEIVAKVTDTGFKATVVSGGEAVKCSRVTTKLIMEACAGIPHLSHAYADLIY